MPAKKVEEVVIKKKYDLAFTSPPFFDVETYEKSNTQSLEKYPNKKILNAIPLKYIVDGRDMLGSRKGRFGEKLELKILFVTIPENHYEAYMEVFQKAGIPIAGITVAPLADAEAALSYKDKTQGSLIINIGAETTSLSTFENNSLTSLKVLPIGSEDINNDIALGLQVSLEDAENIKCGKKHDLSQKKVDEVINARITDILELAERHLISIKKNRLFPAGVVLTGGGSALPDLATQTGNYLKLPARTLQLQKVSKKTGRDQAIGSQFSVSYGLCLGDIEPEKKKRRSLSLGSIGDSLKKMIDQITP